MMKKRKSKTRKKKKFSVSHVDDSLKLAYGAAGLAVATQAIRHI